MRKQKKIRYLLTSFLVCLLTFGSALQTFAATIVVDTNDDDNTITGDCELREAVTSANSNTATDGCIAGEVSPTIDSVQFDPGMVGQTVTLTGGQLPTLTETVEVDGDITNDGVPDITIDAGGVSRVFDVNAPDVTVRGFNFLNGAQAGENGGTIRVRSAADLSLIDSTVNESPAIGTANAVNGGAISVETGADDVTLFNVDIANTSASDAGGAVYIGSDADTVLMHDVTINDTTATNGGAIFVDTENTQADPEDLELQLEYSSIQNTTATNAVVPAHGGAISLNNNVEANLDNVTIDNSQADNHGGAIYTSNETIPPTVDTDNLVMTDTSISNSTANIDNGTFNGGCIYVGDNVEALSNNNLNLNTCEGFWGGGVYVGAFAKMIINGVASLLNNSAQNGGGIYISSGANFTNDGVGALIFNSNSAALNGGAVYIQPSAASDVNINNAEFHQNQSSVGGGAIFVDADNTLNITDSEFFENNSVKGGGINAQGGAINPVNVNISNSNFEGNVASGGFDGYGGAIYAGVRTMMTLDTITTDVPDFISTGNSAGVGGGFLWMNNPGDDSTLTINNSGIHDSTAQICGALRVDSAYTPLSPPIQLHNVQFSGNTATAPGGFGGALCSQRGSILMDSVTLSNNTAVLAGGGLDLEAASGNLSTVISGTSSFIDNFSDSGGGIFVGGYGFTSELSIIGATFLSFFTGPSSSGGVIYILESDVNIDGSVFTSNDTAWVNDGGAIYNDIGNLSINNTTISHFIVNGNGGALYNRGGTNTITNSTISNNAANTSGGAVYSARSGANVTVNQSYIGENSAINGGAFYIDKGGLEVVNSTINNNQANGGNGGGFFLGTLATGINIFSTTIAHNNAFNQGGGLLISAGILVDLANTIIADNTSGVTGSNCENNGSFSASGHNLISETTDGCGTVFQPTDIINIPAHLGALDYHGGTTLNYTLLPNSPAINNGGVGQIVDQRGVARPQGVTPDIGSHEYEDNVPPTIAEVTPVITPGTDTTPDYTFSSDEAGSITYGGGCTSATTSASIGSVTITFNALPTGTYAMCTITVTDILGNISNLLNITSFTIDAIVIPPAPSGGGGGSASFGQPACSGNGCSAPSTPVTPVVPAPTAPVQPNTPVTPVAPTPVAPAPTAPVQPNTPVTPVVPTPVAPISPTPTAPVQPNTPAPDRTTDVTQIANDSLPPILPTSNQKCNYDEFNKKYNLTAGTIWQDSDGDGLSNNLECQFATDPTNIDTDNDGQSDSNEALNLFTDPNKPEQLSTSKNDNFVVLSLPEDRLTTADEAPIFMGKTQPENLVNIFLFNSADFDKFREELRTSVNQMEKLSEAEKQLLYNEKFNRMVELILQKHITQSLDPKKPEEAKFIGKIISVGKSTADQNGVFLHDSNINLRNNRYLAVGTDNTVFSNPIEFTVDSSLAFISPEAQTLNNQKITPEILSGQAVLHISSDSNKPILTGKVTVPSRVVALWKSYVTGSALIADSFDQEFRMTPPKALEPGEHTVYLTAYRNTDNAQSKTQKITFILDPVSETATLPWWAVAIVVFMALLGTGFAIKYRMNK